MTTAVWIPEVGDRFLYGGELLTVQRRSKSGDKVFLYDESDRRIPLADCKPVTSPDSRDSVNTGQFFEVGDRIIIHQYTPAKATDADWQQWRRNKWVLPTPDRTWNRHELWRGWAIVVLRVEANHLIVTSEEFIEPTRSDGVRVPISHVELVRRSYGLPAIESTPPTIAKLTELVPEIRVHQSSIL